MLQDILIFDLETTGVDVTKDRIIQLGYCIIEGAKPEGGHHLRYGGFLCNPEIPIPEEASNVHGITDADVQREPTFQQRLPEILNLFRGYDIAGFNVLKYDLPLIQHELQRAGYTDPFPFPNVQVIDVMKIYHRHCSRTLTDAVKYYLNTYPDNAHDAVDDAHMTAQVLLQQVIDHKLPYESEQLAAYSQEKPANYIDEDGKFVWIHGEACLGFGKHRETPLKDLVKTKDKSFLSWMLDKDFSEEAKAIAKNALSGVFPQKERAL